MKSITFYIFASTAAAAAIRAVAPVPSPSLVQQQEQPPKNKMPLEQREQDMPQGERLPWIQRDFFKCAGDRAGKGVSEQCAGTAEYCNAFDDKRVTTDKKFLNSKECFDAHEPEPEITESPDIERRPGIKETPKVEETPAPQPKLPWKPMVGPGCDGSPIKTNENCGTKIYCLLIELVPDETDKKYRTTSECFNAHEPEHSA